MFNIGYIALLLFFILILFPNRSNTAVERSLLKSLNAYVKHFETPNTREALLAIASSILTFQQKQESLAISPDKAESFTQNT